jgi:hypothetical protein
MVQMRLNLRTVSALNARENWRKRAQRVRWERYCVAVALVVKDQRERPAPPTPPKVRPADLEMLRKHYPAPFDQPVVVTMTRVSPGEVDDDNLPGAMKAVRDELSVWLCEGNDRDPRVQWRYAQKKESKTHAVIITVESV